MSGDSWRFVEVCSDCGWTDNSETQTALAEARERAEKAEVEVERLTRLLPPRVERAGGGVGEGSWSVFAEQMMTERDDALARELSTHAEVRACLGDIVALDPYLPPGWRRTENGWERGEKQAWRTPQGWALVNTDDYGAVWTTDPSTWGGVAHSIFDAMAAADKSLDLTTRDKP